MDASLIVMTAISTVAAALAAYFGWKAVALAHRDRRERATAGFVRATEEVRRAAAALVASYDDGRGGEDPIVAARDLDHARDRLRLLLLAEGLPPGMASRPGVASDVEELLGDRPLRTARAASRVFDALAAEQRDRATHSRRPARLRRRAARWAFDVEPQPRPSGGHAIRTAKGRERRYELILPMPGGGLGHYWCDADDERPDWHGPVVFATVLGGVDAVAACLADFGARRIEIVARVGTRLHHLSRPTSFDEAGDDAADLHGPPPALPAPDVRGTPAIIQGLYGNTGNFEVVAPVAGGGLVHLWRDNDRDGRPWSDPVVFPRGSKPSFDAVALIHSNLEGGHLEVVARSAKRLHHFWRDNASPATWREAAIHDAAGNPIDVGAWGVAALIQSRRQGSRGNFELVVPCAEGGVAHLWRANSQRPERWSWEVVMREAGTLDAVAVFEGRRDQAGRRPLCLVALTERRSVVHVRGFERRPPSRSRQARDAARRLRGGAAPATPRVAYATAALPTPERPSRPRPAGALRFLEPEPAPPPAGEGPATTSKERHARPGGQA
jgi:hypothetical protein